MAFWQLNLATWGFGPRGKAGGSQRGLSRNQRSRRSRGRESRVEKTGSDHRRASKMAAQNLSGRRKTRLLVLQALRGRPRRSRGSSVGSPFQVDRDGWPPGPEDAVRLECQGASLLGGPRRARVSRAVERAGASMGGDGGRTARAVAVPLPWALSLAAAHPASELPPCPFARLVQGQVPGLGARCPLPDARGFPRPACAPQRGSGRAASRFGVRGHAEPAAVVGCSFGRPGGMGADQHSGNGHLRGADPTTSSASSRSSSSSASPWW